MIIQHPDFASMTVRSERIRQFAVDAGCDAKLHDDDDETTTIIHYPDGRIEIDCEGDVDQLVDVINDASNWPDDVESVDP